SIFHCLPRDLNIDKTGVMCVNPLGLLFDMSHKKKKFQQVAMRALGFEVKKVDVLKILKDYDREGNGKITFEDFNEVVTDRILERDPKEEIMKAFKLFDDDESGKISLRNLRRVARELGENVSDEELRSMIDEFDTDGDGEINQEEFLAIMTADS
uniref:EF-hand domain-containing protein n=1 Tax=Monopterus albus TaxID=43700 RepID=A0A3Q3J2R4_MONAL